MFTLLSTFFAWALKNQMITGFLTLVGSKIYLLIEDYIKKKYFSQPQIVEIKECDHKIIKKKVAKKQNINLGYILLFSILGLLGIYIFFTYQQFPYLKPTQIADEIEKIKLFTILLVVFLASKLLSFNTTLEELFKTLPIIKSFFKK